MRNPICKHWGRISALAPIFTIILFSGSLSAQDDLERPPPIPPEDVSFPASVVPPSHPATRAPSITALAIRSTHCRLMVPLSDRWARLRPKPPPSPPQEDAAERGEPKRATQEPMVEREFAVSRESSLNTQLPVEVVGLCSPCFGGSCPRVNGTSRPPVIDQLCSQTASRACGCRRLVG